MAGLDLPDFLDDIDALVLDEDGEGRRFRVTRSEQSGESFVGAQLDDVELVGCDLAGCDFSEASLRRVRFVECRATAIDFGQARLRDVEFVDCRCADLNLRLASVRSTRFVTTLLTGAEFVAAELDTVSFAGCDLSRADFRQSRGTGVDLRNARLDGLRGVAALRGARIDADQLVILAPALADAVGLVMGADGEPPVRS